MKDVFLTVDKAGRITLPKSVREKLAINPGDLVKLSTQAGQVTLRPTRAGFVKRGRGLLFSAPTDELLSSESCGGCSASNLDEVIGQYPPA